MTSLQTQASSSVDAQEVAQFSALASQWWDVDGPFAPLHRLTPVRMQAMTALIAQHVPGRDTSDRASLLEGLTLLDVGCGGGLVSEPMTRLGAQVLGIDASQENIQAAAAHAQGGGLPTQYRAMSAESLAEEGQQFDVVLALEIVEHVADLGVFMQAIAQLVAPGGLLILSTINRTTASLLQAKIAAEYLLRWVPAGTHDWQKFVTPAELASQLRANGLLLRAQCGMVFDPVHWEWSVKEEDLSVNYLLAAQKPL